MAKKPTVTTIASGYASTTTLNSNFEALREGFDNTLSLDGSTPNAMQADLDLNGNDIINAGSILVDGDDLLALTQASLTAAQTALTAAELAETNAETSETNAATSATSASTSASNAATSASQAASSAVAASGSATASAASVVAAESAEVGAETAETNAAASAAAASTSATNAATSATNAASSATAAAGSASTATAASDAALAALDSFDDRYLGQKASDPTLDNDGNPLVTGALYFNTTDGTMKVYEGSSWVAAYASISGALLATNNLSDLVDASAARTNLGLATVATTGAYSDLTGTPAPYADADVDTHLNTGTAATGEYLSWNGADYDWATVPAGYADADVDTHLNTGTATTDQVLAWSGSDYDWVDASAGATGGGTDKIFIENGQVVTTNYTVTATTNAMTTGPIDINAGVTVTVETGGRWVVI
ncbi:tail fiber protein [Lentibacter phage vB_LenP_ICBM2]|uniref:Tail protein n=1 Tax=Lentibacter phage vB_LenP_ICBM2 TaxID=2847823 RepID=A0A3G2YRY7_9CAUD|nr:tail fiber protein [Lentibacter phage vB_LenP_ICBM2]AYP28113.1 tail protein [Lentibacter phage vB_LenP_ICBM2]